jgi:large repetitive protein
LQSLTDNGLNPVTEGQIFLKEQIAYDSFTVTPTPGHDGKIIFYWNGFDSLKWAESPEKVIINYNNSIPNLTPIERVNLKQDEVQIILNSEFKKHYYDSDKNDSAETFYLDIPSDLPGTFKINNDIATIGTNSILFKNLIKVSFTPNTGYEDSINVRWGISDGQDTGYSYIRFNFVNSPPVAKDVSLSGTEDIPIIFTPAVKTAFLNSFYDADLNDQPVEILISSLPVSGKLTLFEVNPVDTGNVYFYSASTPLLRSLRYTPNKNWNGIDSFRYKTFDGTDWSANEATVWITISAVNDPPSPKKDIYSIYEDSILNRNVTENDTDVDDSIKYCTVTIDSIGTAGIKGKIELDLHGNLIYTPLSDSNGIVWFTYSLCDTSKACATARVTITIIPVNDPPTAVNDTITIFDNTKFYSSVDTTRLLYNDRDPEGDSIFISRIGKGYPGDTTMGNSGKIIAGKDGNFTYFPDSAKVISLDENEVLIDSFQYVVSDFPEGLPDSAWLMIRIKGLNTRPHAVNDIVNVDENIILDFNPNKTLLTNDSDPENNPISITKIDGDSTGLIKGTTGILKWEHNGQFYYKQGDNNDLFDYLAEGDTAMVEFTYKLEDSHKAAAFAKLVIIINGKNDPPVALPDTCRLLETTASVSIDSKNGLLVNDYDVDRGDSIHVSKINSDTKGKYGTLVWYGDGSYTYYNNLKATESLPEGKIVYDVFPYTLSDRLDSTATGFLYIKITGVDNIPKAVNDTLSVMEDSHSGSLRAWKDGLLVNDTDVDRDSLKVTSFNFSTLKRFDTKYGTITWDSLGNIDFVVKSNAVDFLQVGETATEAFWYIVIDPSGEKSTAQLMIIIKGENDNPVAVNDRVSITEKTDFISGTVADSTSLLSNDWDVEGDPISATLVNGLPGSVAVGLHGYGELHWDSTGAYTYYTYQKRTDTLAQGEIVPDQFVYSISDHHGGSDTASFIIDITGINDPPVAVPDSNSTKDVQPIIVLKTDTTDVLYNDYDVDGHRRKLTAVNGDSLLLTSEGKYGILNWDTTGSYIYRPDSAFAVSLRPFEQVTDTFTYKVEDEFKASDTTQLQLTIVGINNAPIARNDTLVVYEDDISRQLPAPGLLIPKNVHDPDRDTLKVKIITGPNNYGNLTWDSTGKVSFSPDQTIIHQLGYEQVITESFGYTIVDEGGLTARANLIVKIIGENDPVIAINDTLRMDEDSFGKKNVVLNDKDVDNNGKGNFDYESLSIVDNFGPYHGTASRNSFTGEIYYHPDKDFFGKDSLKYSISDTGEPVYCDSAWLKIEVRPVNDPPVATNLVLKTPMNTPVEFEYLKQVTDIDDGINLDSLRLPVNPKIKKNNDFIIYTPDSGFTGIDEFTYSMKDYSNVAAYVIVTVIVGDTLSGFSAQDDYISTNEETPVDINILDNDTIGGETPDPRTVEIKVFPKNGVAIFDPGKQVINYQPDKDFNGADSLEYLVSSGPGNWSSAKVYITVIPVNDPIVVIDDLAETFVGKATTIPVLANDYDPDNGIDTTSFKILQSPKLGTASFSYTTGKLNYTSTSTIGIDTLVYKICDLNQTETSCDSALVIILVKSESSGFTAKNDNYTTDENKPLNLINPTTWANDKNIDPKIVTDSTSLKVLSGPLHGGETINPDYTVTYTPETNYFGPDWMEYIVSDSAGNWDKAEINIWVNEVNITPVAVDDTDIVTQNDFKRLFVLENDYDLDGTLDWSKLDTVSGKGPRNGKIVFDRNTGTILYKPSINTGQDQFTYRIYDNKGAYADATVSITIELETTIYIRRSTNEDTPVTIDVTTEMVKYNLAFPINTIFQEIAPKLGTYSFGNNNKDLTYTPEPDLNGKDTIWLNVWSKDNSESASLRIFITIIPVNDAPVAVEDTIHWINSPDAKVITFDSLLVNDYDVDGDQILLTDSVIQTGYDKLHVIFNADSTITITTNTILWCDAWFTYEIKDKDGLSDTAKVFIFPKLDGITAIDDDTIVWERGLGIDSKLNLIDVLANDLFVDNQRCTIDTIIIITQPQHGSATGTPDNYVDYTPTRHYFGPDSLQYKIIDIWGQHSTAWVHIEVLEKNTPPVAVNDIVACMGSAIHIPVLNNDYDPDAVGTDGDPSAHIVPDSTRMTLGSDPQFGIVTFDPVNFNFIYTPDMMSCVDSFRYTIFDNEHGSDTATVTINFNEAPIFANPDIKKTYPGVEAEVEPLLNDSGYFVPELTTNTIPLTIHGTVNWNSQNIVTYIPDKSFIGRDSILYTLVSPCGNEQRTYIIFSVEELRVPEIISPNGDGKNDVLMIDGIEYFPDNLLQIYNRYGHVVYQKKGYLNEWGGYSNRGSLGGDKPLPAGTYYYTLIYNEGRNRQAGSIYIFW